MAEVTVKKLQVEIDGDASGIKKGTKEAEKSMSGLEASAAQMGKKLIAAFAVEETIRRSIGAVVDFQKAQANVASLGVPTKGFEEGILNLSGELGGATELTEGLYMAISAGAAPANALDVVSASAGFAKANLAGMAKSVDVVTTVMNVFGGSAEHIADVLTTVVAKGKTTGEELSESFGPVASGAKAMGASFEDIAAATVSLTAGGIATSQSMTGLTAIFSNIATPSKVAADTAERLGINFSIAGLQAKGFGGFMQELSSKTQGNTQDLKNLFGSTEAFNAMARLASQEGMASFIQAQKDIESSTGATQKAMAEQQKSFSAVSETIKNELEATVIKALLPAFKSLSTWLGEHKDDIQSFFTGAVGAITEVGGLVVKLAPVITGVGVALTAAFAIKKITPFVSGVGDLVKNFTLARSIGISSVNSIGMSLEQTTGKMGFLNQNVTGLGGALKNIGPIAAVAFGSWEIGKLIGEIPLVSQAVQSSTLTLDAFIEKQAEIARQAALSDNAKQSAKSLAELREITGLTNGSLSQLTKYFMENKAAMELLEGPKRTLILRSIEHQKAIEAEAKAEAERAKVNFYTSETVKKAIGDVIVKTNADKTSTEQQDKAVASAKKYKDEIESLSKSLGILTDDGYKELTKETGNLNTIFESGKSQWTGNQELTDKLKDKIDALIVRFQDAGIKIPESLIKMRDAILLVPPAMDSAKESLEKYGGAIPGVISDIEENQDAILSLDKATGNYTDKAEEDRKEQEKRIESNKRFFDSLDKMFGAVSDGIGIMESLGIVSGDTAKALDGVTSGAYDVAGGIESFTSGDIVGGMIGVAKGLAGIGKAIAEILHGHGELEEAKRRLAGIEGGEKYAAELEKIAEGMTGANTAGRAFNSMLAQIIKDTPVSANQFRVLSVKVREVVSAFEQGNATIQETTENFGAAFASIAEYAAKAGQSGSAEMIGLIELSREFGINAKEVIDYENAQKSAAFSFFGGLKEAADMGTMIEDLAALKEEMAGLDGVEYETAAKKAAELEKAIGNARTAQEFLGLTSFKTLDDMYAMQEKVSQNQGLIDSINNVTGVYVNMSNVQELTQDQFTEFEKVGKAAFDKLKAAGFSSTETMQAMGPTLERLEFLQQQYGYKIDDSTQAMINQWNESGRLGEKTKSDTQKMTDAVDGLNETVKLLARAFGVDIPEAVDAMGNSIRGAADRARRDLDSVSKSAVEVGKNIDGVTDAVDGLGEVEDRVFNTSSIIPDFSTWHRQVIDVSKQIKNDLTKSVNDLGNVWEKRKPNPNLLSIIPESGGQGNKISSKETELADKIKLYQDRQVDTIAQMERTGDKRFLPLIQYYTKAIREMEIELKKLQNERIDSPTPIIKPVKNKTVTMPTDNYSPRRQSVNRDEINGISSPGISSKSIDISITADNRESSYALANKIKRMVERNEAGLTTAIAREVA